MNRFLGLLCVLCSCSLVLCYDLSSCGLALRTSDMISGLGVYATRRYGQGDVVERIITLPIHPDKFPARTVFRDYSYGHYEGDVHFFDIALGYSMLYNHHEYGNVQIVSTRQRSPRLHIYSTEHKYPVYDFVMVATRDIDVGEELLHSYGSDSWFHDREIPYVNLPQPNKISMDVLTNPADVYNLPGCPFGLTEVYDGRVFAKSVILKGTIIEVSRALIFDSYAAVDTALDMFIWRSLAYRKSMLLLGNGALYRGRNDGEAANVGFSWFEEPQNNSAERRAESSMNTDGAYETSPIVCSDRMLIRFVATEDIDVHEELIINLFKAYEFEGGPVLERYAEFHDQCF